MRRHSFQVFLVPAVMLTCMMLVGCEQGGNSSDNAESEQVSTLPKLKFHCPGDFAGAVDRITELYSAIKSNDAMPEPAAYTVREVIHGSGTAAHSHYYLADDSRGQDDHGHEDLESGEKLHDVKVDAFNELADIVGWLPDIAGKADMAETQWNEVNNLSTEFGDLLDGMMDDGSDTEAVRTAIRTEDKFSQFIEKLSALIPASVPPKE